MKTKMKMFDLWDVADGRCHIFVRKDGEGRWEHVLDGRNGPLLKYDEDISDYIVKNAYPAYLPNYGNVLEVVIYREEE